MSRARHLICATVAKLPLVALTGDVPAGYQPQWCFVTDGQLGDLTDDQMTTLRAGRRSVTVPTDAGHRRRPAVLRLVAVAGHPADLAVGPAGSRIGWSASRTGLWDVNTDNEITDQDGHPFAAGQDMIDGEWVDRPADVVLIEGPHEGVLNFGATTIRAASTLEQSAAETARTPFRIGVHQTSEVTLTDDERRGVVDDVRRALAENNGILFTNSALELTEYRLDSAELLVGGRQAAALDVARHLNIPGAMIDAEPTGSTLTYSNPESRNQQWLDYGLVRVHRTRSPPPCQWTRWCPSGQRTAFDTSTLTTTLAPSTGAPTAD